MAVTICEVRVEILFALGVFMLGGGGREGWEERGLDKGKRRDIHGKGCDFDGQAVEILICEVVGIWYMRGTKRSICIFIGIFGWNCGRKTTKGRKEAKTA